MLPSTQIHGVWGASGAERCHLSKDWGILNSWAEKEGQIHRLHSNGRSGLIMPRIKGLVFQKVRGVLLLLPTRFPK